MEELELKIVSPEKILFQGNVHIVKLPGTEGEFSILHNHAPFISSLGKGAIVYEVQKGGESASIDINSGFVEVNRNVVTVCVE